MLGSHTQRTGGGWTFSLGGVPATYEPVGADLSCTGDSPRPIKERKSYLNNTVAIATRILFEALAVVFPFQGNQRVTNRRNMAIMTVGKRLAEVVMTRNFSL